MSRLIETLNIKNGIILNLSHHNERLNRSRSDLFSSSDELDLVDYIMLPRTHSKGRIKCRVLYSTIIHHIEYLIYSPKMIESLSIISADDISYEYKYENRSELSNLYKKRGNCDDILIVKNGYVTDTYYCNIALFKHNRWVTPKTPLLKGVQRRFLIDEGKIFPDYIRLDALDEYESIRLFNSMLEFGEIEFPISSIKKVE